MAKPVRLRELAVTDLELASEYYREQADERTAPEFIDAAERAIGRIGRSPHLGSLRFAHELAIPELRAWALERFPHVVFYVDTRDVVDVWRILHTRRDIPATLQPPEA